MGLILDTSLIIAAERQGHTVLEILEQVQAAFGETELGLSVVTIAELTHGAYRAADLAKRQRRIAFVERLCNDIPVYPFTNRSRSAGRKDRR